MLKITCPWCGEKSQEEFSFHGEAHIIRPPDNADMSDEEWGDYIFFRDNKKGWVRERVVHTSGCRRWFNAVRHSVSDKVVVTYKPSDEKPPFPGDVS